MYCTFSGYRPCRNAEEIIASSGYEPERDTANSPDSVFCAHGTGFVVPWNEVEKHMHLPSVLREEKESEPPPAPAPRRAVTGAAMDKELQAIFERTYGPVKERSFVPAAERRSRESYRPKAAPVPSGPEYILVDGYNIIYAWDELHSVAENALDAARLMLMDRMSNYRALRDCELILVFRTDGTARSELGARHDGPAADGGKLRPAGARGRRDGHHRRGPGLGAEGLPP